MQTYGLIQAFGGRWLSKDGKKALRVKDENADSRRHFAGLDYFSIDPSWRVVADWVPFDPPHELEFLLEEPPAAEAERWRSEVIPPLRSAALLSAVVPRNFRRVIMWSRSRRFELCLVIMVSPVALFRE